MMRLITGSLVLYLLVPNVHGQVRTSVYQDTNGQILTTLSNMSRANGSSSTKVTLAGSPFLTFPVWQKGKMRLDRQSREMTGELAYNLVTSEVLYRAPGDSAVNAIVPETFVLDGAEFIRQSKQIAGLPYHTYTAVIFEGPTRLLTSLTKEIVFNVLPANGYNNHGKDDDISGIYKTKTNYYIQKGQAPPVFISLTKNSVLAALYEQTEKLAARLPAKSLTAAHIASVLPYYDSLMAVSRINKLPLAVDPVFTQTLHNEISYPGYAQKQGIYGRVYVGFEIDEQGRAKDIVVLSPDNAGFRFDIVVRKALEKLPVTAPDLHGKYVLPVAFIYTNSSEKTGPHLPVNRLSDDRLAGRVVLDELVVSAVVSKPVSDSQEVWGYYR